MRKETAIDPAACADRDLGRKERLRERTHKNALGELMPAPQKDEG